MSEETDAVIEIDKMSVDQFAGAVVLILGAIGSLLLVIWQSKCHCKVNLCYLFQCERRPPNEEEMKSLKDQAKKMKDKKNNNKDVSLNDTNSDVSINDTESEKGTLSRKSSMVLEPEPEPEIEKLI